MIIDRDAVASVDDVPAQTGVGYVYRSGLSGKGFAIGLYLEHLEEASFLLDQRRDVLLDDPELAWSDLDEFEERLEAHLDALVLGEDLALAVCLQQVSEGDAGELHAAVRVFCRHGRKDLVDKVVDDLDDQNDDRVHAVRDALRDELPAAWEGDLVNMLGRDEPWQQRLAADVVGYRRLGAGNHLMAALPQANDAVVRDLVWALGRLRVAQARQPLYNNYLRHEDDAVREASALALLRLGEPAVLRHLLSFEVEQPWAIRLIGICGSQFERRRLLEIVSERGPSDEALLALGLLGDVEAVGALLYHLEEPTVAGSAALGLYLITGAELIEDAFIPEEVDEDELFEDELEMFRNGEPLLRPDGEPSGTSVIRLSQSPETWMSWWEEHGPQFQSGVRYRTGRPCSPDVLVDNLQSDRLPRYVRQLVYEELVIRFGIDGPFETEAWVRHQRTAIARLQADATSRESSYRAGRWYLGGHLQSGRL